jgi:hypothetical protein
LQWQASSVIVSFNQHSLMRFIVSVAGLFSLMLLNSCVGKKAVIKQVYAYSSIHMPGIAMKDENGNEMPAKIDTVVNIYVEAGSNNIVWDSAWSSNRQFSITPYTFMEQSLELGVLKNSGEKVIISKTDTANRIIRLTLEPVETKNYIAPANLQLQEIFFRGTFKGKVIVWNAGSVKELATLPAY